MYVQYAYGLTEAVYLIINAKDFMSCLDGSNWPAIDLAIVSLIDGNKVS